jgi:hypothetical protein
MRQYGALLHLVLAACTVYTGAPQQSPKAPFRLACSARNPQRWWSAPLPCCAPSRSRSHGSALGERGRGGHCLFWGNGTPLSSACRHPNSKPQMQPTPKKAADSPPHGHPGRMGQTQQHPDLTCWQGGCAVADVALLEWAWSCASNWTVPQPPPYVCPPLLAMVGAAHFRSSSWRHPQNASWKLPIPHPLCTYVPQIARLQPAFLRRRRADSTRNQTSHQTASVSMCARKARCLAGMQAQGVCQEQLCM